MKRKTTAPKAVQKAAPKPVTKVPVLRLRAKTGKIRNPFSGQLFTTTKYVEIADFDSHDNVWTKNQMRAGVLVEA